MGIVFKAVHEEFNDVVAIKCLAPSPPRGTSPSASRRSARCTPSSSTDTSCTCVASGVAPTVLAQPPLSGRPPIPFIVMDLLEGKTLARILDKYRRLDFLNTLARHDPDRGGAAVRAPESTSCTAT